MNWKSNIRLLITLTLKLEASILLFFVRYSSMSEKKENPEKRLQSSVARDVKLRLLEEAAKHQADCLAVARWDNALATKDLIVTRRRQEAAVASDERLTNKAVKAERRARLEALYQEDEIRFNEELSAKGLSFRRLH